MSGLQRPGPQPHHHHQDVWGPGQHHRQGPHDRVGPSPLLGRQGGLPRQEEWPLAALLRGVAFGLRGRHLQCPAGYHILLHPTLLYSILVHPILLHSILPHSILLHYVPSCSICHYCTLFCRGPAIFHPTPAYSILSHSVTLYPTYSIQFYVVPLSSTLPYCITSHCSLFCPILAHPILPHSVAFGADTYYYRTSSPRCRLLAGAQPTCSSRATCSACRTCRRPCHSMLYSSSHSDFIPLKLSPSSFHPVKHSLSHTASPSKSTL